MEATKVIKKGRTSHSEFRLNSARFFLTYSQCSVPKADMKTHLESVGGKLREYIIVREYHLDGNAHLHATVKFENRVDTTRPAFFDFGTYHPNIQKITNNVGWFNRIHYCRKFDPEPLEYFEKNIQDEKKERNKALLEELTTKGVNKCLQEGTISVHSYSSLKKAVAQFQEETKEEPREELPAQLENPWQEPFTVDTDIKKCHLWLYSRLPNLGKTTWASELEKKYVAELWNLSEEFQPHISPKTECLILDEFRGQLKISTLNQLCDGNLFLKAKGRDSWRLNQKPLVIVLSNKSISEVYHQSDTVLLEARFQEIELMKFKTAP